MKIKTFINLDKNAKTILLNYKTFEVLSEKNLLRDEYPFKFLHFRQGYSDKRVSKTY